MSSRNNNIYLSFLLDDEEIKAKITEAVQDYINKNLDLIIEKEIGKKIDYYIERYFESDIPYYSDYTVEVEPGRRSSVNKIINKKVKDAIGEIITDTMLSEAINKVAKEFSDKIKFENEQ